MMHPIREADDATAWAASGGWRRCLAVAAVGVLAAAGCSSDGSAGSDGDAATTATAPDEAGTGESNADETNADETSTGDGGLSSVTGLSIVAELEVGDAPWTAVVVDDLAWVPHQGGITAVDADLTPVHQLDLAGHPETPLWFDDRLWFADIAEPVVTIVDPDEPTAFYQAAAGRQGITPVAAQGSVWVPNRADGTVSRIAPDTLESTTIPGLDGLRGLLEIGDEVYAVIEGTVWQVSADGAPEQIDTLPPSPALEAFGARWAVEGDELVVTGGPVDRVVIGSPIVEVAATEESIVVVARSGILRVDPGQGVITGGLDVEARQPLVGAAGVWFIVGAPGEQTTIGYVDDRSFELFETIVDGEPDHFALLDGTLIVSLKRGNEVVAVATEGG